MARIRWGRVIAAAVFSELAVIALLMGVTGVYVLFSHRSTVADLQQFGDRAGYYLAPVASGLATFLSARWAVRKLTANVILNGTMVGVVAVLLTVGFLASAKAGDRLMYVVSFALRLAGAYLGGWTTQTRSAVRGAGQQA